MENKTIYITLLDGYCSSYFMKEVSYEALIKPTLLTFQYSRSDYRIFAELSKYSFSPMTFESYQDYKENVENENSFDCVIPTFEEIWVLIINELINKSIKELRKYKYVPSKIIFTISESYKFHGIYQTVIDVISQFSSLYLSLEFSYINYPDVIENFMIKDYYINMGSEKIDSDIPKQIHSFIEIGLNSTLIYTMKIDFKTENGLIYPYKTKLLEKIIIPIGLTSALIELLGDDSKSFGKQSLYFIKKCNENLNKNIPNLNATTSTCFIDNNDDKVSISRKIFCKTTFGVTILDELESIRNDWNPLTIKQISYTKLSFLLDKVIRVREGNGTSEGSFYTTGFVNLIYDGIYRIKDNTSTFRPIKETFETPLVDFDTIPIVHHRFNHEETLNCFNNLNIEYQHCLAIKNKVQNEVSELYKMIDATSEIKKMICDARKLINIMAANNGDEYYQLWCHFKNKLLN